MATVNLGRIKPVFRGAYSGSTAYVVDDIVTHSDETYICIQAHGAGTQAVTQTAYWTKLAAKGADGTNVATTLTTQGDILYRDGSGLQRLAAGTNGHVLTTGGSGANPSWAAAGGGKINQVKQVITNSQLDLNSSSSFVDFTGMSLAITPSASNSKILIMADVQFDLTTGDRGFQIQILRDSTVVFAGGNNKSTYTGSGRIACRNAYFELDEPASTSSLTYKIQVQTDSSGSSRFNQGSSRSSIVLMEVLA